MTLEEKFEVVEYGHINFLEGLVEVADEFAIGFAEYVDNYLQTTIKTKTIEELLEIYKKEKGL